MSRRVEPAKATELPAKPEPASCTTTDVVCTGFDGGSTPFRIGTAAVTENKAPSTITTYAKAVDQLDAYLASVGMPRAVAHIHREHIEGLHAVSELLNEEP